MIGAVIAMQNEADVLLRDMQIETREILCHKPVYRGTVYDKRLVLIVCGVGKVNAACGAQLLIDRFGVDTVVNFGVAGGIGDSTQICAVYQIEKVVQYDFDLAGLNGTQIGTLNEFTDKYLPVCTNDLLPRRALATGDRFNDDRADYLLLRDYMQADIREMEGGAVAQVCAHAAVPVYLWKAISDKAGNVSSFEQYNANMQRALENLHGYLPALFNALP